MGSLKKGWRRMKVAMEGIRNMVVEEIRNMVVGIRRIVERIKREETMKRNDESKGDGKYTSFKQYESSPNP